MKKRSIDIKGIITQFVLIVFSVVLGLYLSERIEERKKEKESDELLNKITSEVKNNILLLEDWVPYHQEIKKNLDSLSKDALFIEAFINDKNIFFEELFTRGTFMGLFPTNDAWDIAKAHPLIVNIDYDKLIVLSRIYKQQENTFEPGFKMFELLNSIDVNQEKNATLNLELISNQMHELVARELQLVYYYRNAEEILDLKDDKDVDE